MLLYEQSILYRAKRLKEGEYLMLSTLYLSMSRRFTVATQAVLRRQLLRSQNILK